MPKLSGRWGAGGRSLRSEHLFARGEEVGERSRLGADNSLVRALRREDLEVLLSRARAVLYARFMQTEEESALIGSSSHGGEATARSPHR